MSVTAGGVCEREFALEKVMRKSQTQQSVLNVA